MEGETVSRKGFIRSATLLAVLPAGFAASCGGGTSSNGGGGQTTPATTPDETAASPEETTVAEETAATEPPPESADAIASASDVPPGSAAEFEDGGQPAVLVHLDGGEFVAYSAVCTHRGCTVAFQPDSGELACPCHGSVFDPANGAAVVAGPATSPLEEIPVTESDGSVIRA
jgi:cytochrome b6-f complex iron-sulfur subunit